MKHSSDNATKRVIEIEFATRGGLTFNINLTVGIIFMCYRATMKVAYMLCRTACTRSYVYEQKSKQDNFLYYGQQRMQERFYRCDTLELKFFYRFRKT
jgi:hypothetical protein